MTEREIGRGKNRKRKQEKERKIEKRNPIELKINVLFL
jgi:hypothetical protein